MDTISGTKLPIHSKLKTTNNNQNHYFTVKKSFERKTYHESESDSDTYTVSKSEIVRESETDSDDTVSDKIVVSP